MFHLSLMQVVEYGLERANEVEVELATQVLGQCSGHVHPTQIISLSDFRV